MHKIIYVYCNTICMEITKKREENKLKIWRSTIIHQFFFLSQFLDYSKYPQQQSNLIYHWSWVNIFSLKVYQT